jgi:PTH2 family peptidyl-tRNA hydrolase
LAGVAGFFIGQGSWLGLFSRPVFFSSSKPRKSWPNSYDVKVHADSSDNGSGGEGEDAEADDSGEDDDGDGELATFEGNTDEVKLVLVVRTDLGMGKGEN